MSFGYIRNRGHAGYLAFALLLPCHWSAMGQGATLESDPSVVGVLPLHYPLNRVAVDAREFPWSAVGRITLLDSIRRPGGRSLCTGTLVEENLVLTAAHCVWSRRDFPEEVGFLAGFHQQGYVAHSKATRIHVNGAFDNGPASKRTLSVDWALIELSEPIGRTAGFAPVADFNASVFGDLKGREPPFKLSGYRGDRPFVQTVDHGCRLEGFSGDGNLIIHRCPLIGGDSGGPLLLPVDDELVLVGIDVGASVRKDGDGRDDSFELGFAIPSSSFLDKLSELGVTVRPPIPRIR